jgi:hypothetical protein
MERGHGHGRARLNPDGNERLTAAVGVVLVVLTIAELATNVLGLHQLLSVHVFIGLVLIPPVLLKLASTGWRFIRYYTGSEPYTSKGAPELPMRLLAPLLVAATVILFASGVAMGVLHGQPLVVARRLHGPASVIWMILVGIHVLVYLKRALISSSEDLRATSRASVPGASWRSYLLAGAIVAGLVVGVATLPVQDHWLHLSGRHERESSMSAVSTSQLINSPAVRRAGTATPGTA